MSTLSLILVCVGVLAVNVGALSIEERMAIQKSTLPIVLECAKEHNVKEEDIKAAKENLSTSGLNPCFFRCVFQKDGVMNNNGFYDLEAIKEKSKTYITNEEELNKFESVGKICVAVNDKTVSDGCERAKLLLECFLENKADFTPLA